MKRLFCLMLALMVAIGTGALAEAASYTYNWSDYEPMIEQNGFAGNFYIFEKLAFRIWIPDVLSQYELTEEQLDNGWIDAFATDDMAYSIIVRYSEQPVDTLEALADLVQDQYETCRFATINGYQAMLLLQDNGGTMTVVIPGQDNYFLQVVYNGVTSYQFMNMFSISMSSIQPVEE